MLLLEIEEYLRLRGWEHSHYYQEIADDDRICNICATLVTKLVKFGAVVTKNKLVVKEKEVLIKTEIVSIWVPKDNLGDKPFLINISALVMLLILPNRMES